MYNEMTLREFYQLILEKGPMARYQLIRLSRINPKTVDSKLNRLLKIGCLKKVERINPKYGKVKNPGPIMINFYEAVIDFDFNKQKTKTNKAKNIVNKTKNVGITIIKNERVPEYTIPSKIKEITGIIGRTKALQLEIEDETFPKRIKLFGGRKTAWKTSDIFDWIEKNKE